MMENKTKQSRLVWSIEESSMEIRATLQTAAGLCHMWHIYRPELLTVKPTGIFLEWWTNITDNANKQGSTEI